MAFNKHLINSFIFADWDYCEKTQTASFNYAFDDQHHFQEQLTFKGAPSKLTSVQRKLLPPTLAQLHLALGVSYYKAAIPKTILVKNNSLTESDTKFFSKLYRNGLAEFAHVNKLSLDHVSFPSGSDKNKLSAKALTPGIVVPLGGGKDSLLTIDLLEQAGKDYASFSVGNHKLIHEMAATIGRPYINVQRKISPTLLELNQQGAYNGHVPISSIIAFILASSAVLYGFDTAILSNEASSNSANLVVNGQAINHQYSKSIEFERDFQQQLENFLPGFSYFSLIRPLTELAILKRFSNLKQYHQQFSSCNGNFRLLKKQANNWCGNCPKCRFTFLGLAAFMKPRELKDIFGYNLLNDPNQTDGFNELIGWDAHKPFECVGTYEESIYAFYLASKNKKWCESYQVQRFIGEILPELDNMDSIAKQALDLQTESCIPAAYKELLNAA